MKRNYKDAASVSKFHLILYVSIILGQIACGYALGIAGTAVTQAQQSLGLSTFWVGLLGAGTLIGLAGSLAVGNIADKIGRSKLIMLDMLAFTIFSALQIMTDNVWILLILRICIGLCIAVDYVVGGAIISEWFPGKKSPFYLSMFYIFWVFGYVSSFFAGMVMINLETNYHLIFITSVIPGGLAALVRILIKVPESPGWLCAAGRVKESIVLVEKYIGQDYTVVVPKQTEAAEKVSVRELLKPEYRAGLITGSVFWSCQVFPYFGVGIFLPILVTQLNMGDTTTSSVIYDIFCLVGGFVGLYLCNKISRRRFLTSTFFGAAIALGVMLVAQNAPIVITVIAFAAFALIMSISVVIENPYPPELFDTRVRGTGVGVVVACSRVGAAAGTFLMPLLVESIGIYGTLGVCMAILLFGGIVCQAIAPETSVNHMNKGYVMTKSKLSDIV